MLHFIEDLQTLVELADYYLAMPVVSRTLDHVLLKKGAFCIDVDYNCCQALALATKLRNSILFREALVHVVEASSEEHHQCLEDPKLVKTRRNAHDEIFALVARAQETILSKRCTTDEGLDS